VDYPSSRKVENEDRDPPLWAGTAASKPVAVKVVDPRTRLAVPGIQMARRRSRPDGAAGNSPGAGGRAAAAPR